MTTAPAQDDPVVVEGLSKCFHGLTERAFDAPTPLLTRVFRGRRDPAIEEESEDEEDEVETSSAGLAEGEAPDETWGAPRRLVPAQSRRGGRPRWLACIREDDAAPLTHRSDASERGACARPRGRTAVGSGLSPESCRRPNTPRQNLAVVGAIAGIGGRQAGEKKKKKIQRIAPI